MTTIYAINSDGQERYDSVRPEMVGKTIAILKRQGWLNIRVLQLLNENQILTQSIKSFAVIKLGVQ
jgi:hypothetical protein